MREPRFRSRLLLAFLLVVVVSVGLPLLYARHAAYENSLDEISEAALREARIFGLLLKDNPGINADNLDATVTELGRTLDLRLTFVDRAGRVLADSSIPVDELAQVDNHADRREVTEALANGTGISVRYSETLGSDFVYAAVAFPGGHGAPAGVVRVALPLENVLLRSAAQQAAWLGMAVVAGLLGLLLAIGFSTRLEHSLRAMIRVVESIADGHGPRRLHLVPGREFRGLARAVNDMADRIEDDIRTIERQAAQLATIVDTMAEGVLVLDGEGRIRLANAALRRMFPEVEEGRLPVEVIPVAALQEGLDGLFASGEERRHLQIEPKPGTVLDVSLACPAGHGGGGQGSMAVAVFHDVSDIVRLLRMRRDFVANVSHELRTPLTAIQGYAETLLDLPEEDADNRARFLGIIRRHTAHMSRMVADLLALSRIESGTVPMEKVDVDVSDFLEGCLTQCRPQAENRGLRFLKEVEPGLRVHMDPHFMGQVLRNLCENACRHAPENSVITIRAKRQEAAVLIEVKDEGTGIPEADRNRVFERFYRVEKHRGTTEGGTPSTGLGLAICKHVVERHNGRIWVAKAPGGACFCLALPA